MTANVPSAIPTCVPPLSSGFATNALSEITRTSALSAVARVSQMLSTVLSARDWRRIEMGVRRLSIWEVRGRICFIRKRTLGIIEGGLGLWSLRNGYWAFQGPSRGGSGDSQLWTAKARTAPLDPADVRSRLTAADVCPLTCVEAPQWRSGLQ